MDANRCLVCGGIIPEGRQVCVDCMQNPCHDQSLYAIKHKATGRFVAGTDYNFYPPQQILSDYRPPLLLTGYDLLYELERRKVNMKSYSVVKVTLKEV